MGEVIESQWSTYGKAHQHSYATLKEHSQLSPAMNENIANINGA